MNFLIDTCDALWFFTGDKKLTASRAKLLADPQNIVFFSSVSAVEIAIKHSIGKLTLPEAPAIYIPKLRHLHHFAELPLQESAALLLAPFPSSAAIPSTASSSVKPWHTASHSCLPIPSSNNIPE
jgi:PIN domain nuclease of toxin-antitoxin system